MIRATERLDSFERRYAIEQARTRGFREALAVYEALWKEAVSLNRGFPGAWQDDIDADVLPAADTASTTLPNTAS